MLIILTIVWLQFAYYKTNWGLVSSILANFLSFTVEAGLEFRSASCTTVGQPLLHFSNVATNLSMLNWIGTFRVYIFKKQKKTWDIRSIGMFTEHEIELEFFARIEAKLWQQRVRDIVFFTLHWALNCLFCIGGSSFKVARLGGSVGCSTHKIRVENGLTGPLVSQWLGHYSNLVFGLVAVAMSN